MVIKIFLIHLELFLKLDLLHKSFPQGLFLERSTDSGKGARQERKTALAPCLRHTRTHRWSPPSDLRSQNTCLPRTGLSRADRGCLEESPSKDFMYQPPHSHVFTTFKGVGILSRTPPAPGLKLVHDVSSQTLEKKILPLEMPISQS